MFLNPIGKLWRMVVTHNSFLLSCCISRQIQPTPGEPVEQPLSCQFLFWGVFSEILHFFGVQFLLMPVIAESLNEGCRIDADS
jgi:hypothetical protein